MWGPGNEAGSHCWYECVPCFCHIVGNASTIDMDLAWEGSYEAKLEQVRRLQAEVERLRTIISDQFANQVSSACSVQ